MSSCFLNPVTHFIWAFTAPVILIILINVGFFIMAAIALWRHNKRQTGGEMSKERFGSWLKSLISLVVVMGLTWLIEFLVVYVEVLVPLASIMVAFQGLWIFLVLVVFQKSIRGVYLKLWRTINDKRQKLTGARMAAKRTAAPTVMLS